MLFKLCGEGEETKKQKKESFDILASIKGNDLNMVEFLDKAITCSNLQSDLT